MPTLGFSSQTPGNFCLTLLKLKSGRSMGSLSHMEGSGLCSDQWPQLIPAYDPSLSRTRHGMKWSWTLEIGLSVN